VRNEGGSTSFCFRIGTPVFSEDSSQNLSDRGINSLDRFSRCAPVQSGAISTLHLTSLLALELSLNLMTPHIVISVPQAGHCLAERNPESCQSWLWIRLLVPSRALKTFPLPRMQKDHGEQAHE